jgi:hypothetical protein
VQVCESLGQRSTFYTSTGDFLKVAIIYLK